MIISNSILTVFSLLWLRKRILMSHFRAIIYISRHIEYPCSALYSQPQIFCKWTLSIYFSHSSPVTHSPPRTALILSSLSSLELQRWNLSWSHTSSGTSLSASTGVCGQRALISAPSKPYEWNTCLVWLRWRIDEHGMYFCIIIIRCSENPLN